MFCVTILFWKVGLLTWWQHKHDKLRLQGNGNQSGHVTSLGKFHSPVRLSMKPRRASTYCAHGDSEWGSEESSDSSSFQLPDNQLGLVRISRTIGTIVAMYCVTAECLWMRQFSQEQNTNFINIQKRWGVSAMLSKHNQRAMEHRHWEANSHSASQEIDGTRSSLLSSQQPPPKPDNTQPISFMNDHFNIVLHIPIARQRLSVRVSANTIGAVFSVDRATTHCYITQCLTKEGGVFHGVRHEATYRECVCS
jgi:hypothetical protein